MSVNLHLSLLVATNHFSAAWIIDEWYLNDVVQLPMSLMPACSMTVCADYDPVIERRHERPVELEMHDHVLGTAFWYGCSNRLLIVNVTSNDYFG